MSGGIYILMLKFCFCFHRFTLADMKNGVVMYEHDGGVNFQDSFKFIVKVENIPLDGNVKIRILSESHTDPPHIINNNVITVDENSVTVITEEDLQVCTVIISKQNATIKPCSHVTKLDPIFWSQIPNEIILN